MRKAILSLRILGLILGTLALVAMFSLGVGVDRYIQVLAAAMKAYGFVLDFCFGWIFDLIVEGLADLLVKIIGSYVEIFDHWKHIFTILTLYVFADSFQFFKRPDAPTQSASVTRWLPIKYEAHVGLVSVVAGFILSLTAALIVGLTPSGRDLGSNLVMIGASTGAIFLYWIAMALAHARWNRWNYAQRRGPNVPMEEVESFRCAFRKRAIMAIRRSLIGALAGVIFFLIVRCLSPIPAPGLVTLGFLAFMLGVFWVHRAYNTASGQPIRQKWVNAKLNDNYYLGSDMVLRVVAGAALAFINAFSVGL